MKLLFRFFLCLILRITLLSSLHGQTEIHPKNGVEGLNFENCAKPKIQFLKANQVSQARFGNVGRWENAFKNASDEDILTTLDPFFYEKDKERIYIQIIDDEIDETAISVTIKTLDIDDEIVDERELLLLNQQPTGYFLSEPLILVTNQVDDSEDEHTINIFNPSKILDDPLKIMKGGQLKVEYGEVEKIIPIGRNLETVNIVGFIVNEYIGGPPSVSESDFKEDIALMNIAWAQCGIIVKLFGDIKIVDPPKEELFYDFGFDGIDLTGDEGEGDGIFNFRDNGNNIHEITENSERFIDSNGNNAYDFAVSLIDGLELSDSPVSNEERHLIDTYADDNDQTIEYFAVNRFSNSDRGRAHPQEHIAFLNKPNQFILPLKAIGYAGASPRDFATSAHELGHVLINESGHYEDTEKYVNLMKSAGDQSDSITATKRLKESQCEKVKQFFK